MEPIPATCRDCLHSGALQRRDGGACAHKGLCIGGLRPRVLRSLDQSPPDTCPMRPDARPVPRARAVQANGERWETLTQWAPLGWGKVVDPPCPEGWEPFAVVPDRLPPPNGDVLRYCYRRRVPVGSVPHARQHPEEIPEAAKLPSLPLPKVADGEFTKWEPDGNEDEVNNG